MDYFCYISRTKVDQLHEQLDPVRSDDFTERETTERAKSGGLSAGLSLGSILSLFKGDITYGRKNVIQRERKVKVAYVQKLQEVLTAIAASQGVIPEMREAALSGKSDSLYYHYRGPFRVESPVTNPTTSDIVTIASRIDGHKLLLDCSLRFFSEGPEPDGTFLLHSGNHRFFTGGLELDLESVLVLLDLKRKEIWGTPLFLKLSVGPSMPMAAL